MAVREVVPGLWQVPLGYVNAFLFDTGDGLVLIDTGIPGSSPKILEAVRAIGREPAAIRHILVTYCHSDHAGSAAEMKRLTGAPATMHPTDAEMVRTGKAKRPLTQTPGLLNAFICRFFVGSAPTAIEPAEIEHEVQDGAMLPGGLRAVHVPGHCAGQLAFLWPEHGGAWRSFQQRKQKQAQPAKKPLTPDELNQQLLADGLITQLPNPAEDIDDDDVPIASKGEPLSETIIRERR